jgi:hypothetical protein
MIANKRLARKHRALARAASATVQYLSTKEPRTATISRHIQRQHRLTIQHSAKAIDYDRQANADKEAWKLARSAAWNYCGK